MAVEDVLSKAGRDRRIETKREEHHGSGPEKANKISI
jgi:hypothetical protein